MKALLLFTIMFCSLSIFAQNDARQSADSILKARKINESAAYSVEVPKGFTFFSGPLAKNSILVIDNKIYPTAYLKNFLPSSIQFLQVIKDTTSTTGIFYIYICKTK